jgi:four helix bundle protein
VVSEDREEEVACPRIGEVVAREAAMVVRSYRDLVVWQRAMGLVEKVYRATTGFPKAEVFGLTNQMRRAAVSVPSNVAEGQGQGSTTAFLHFLALARGSLQELETQIQIAGRLGYLASSAADELLEASGEVARVMNGLRSALAARKGESKCRPLH